MTAVIIDKSAFLFWQQEALENIQKIDKDAELFYIEEGNEDYFPTVLLPLCKVEEKVNGSKSTYLKKGDTRFLNISVPFGDVGFKIDLLGFSKIFSLAMLTESELYKIADEKNTEVHQLMFGDEFSAFPLKTIISDYRAKKPLCKVDVVKYMPGSRKETVYTSVSAIEEGLLLKTINEILGKCTLLYGRVLTGQNNTVNLQLNKKIRYAGPIFAAKSAYLQFAIHLLDKIFKKRQWMLLYNFRKDFNILQKIDFYEIFPPVSGFWADPFPFFYKGEYYIFFEELEYKVQKGFLSVLKIGRDRSISKISRILELDSHLSFPFIFEHNGSVYLMPESQKSGKLQLYEAEIFPEKWTHKANLLDDFKGVDTVLKKLGDFWWLFTTLKANNDVSGHEELHIYYAADLFSGEWRPHAKNPVLSDARVGRNPGAIIEQGGVLFRTSQYSGSVYGRGLSVSQIKKLTVNEYEEELLDINFANSGKGHYCTHTINCCGDLVVSDALRRIRRF